MLETTSVFWERSPEMLLFPGQGGAAVLCMARMLPCLVFRGCRLWLRIPGSEDAA